MVVGAGLRVILPVTIYALDGPSYAPEGPTYTLEAPIYALDGASYAPEALTYAPEAPINALDGPSHALDGPSHARESPIRAPDGPIRALDGPSYTPESPIHALDSPIRAPDATIYASEGPSYAPEGPSYAPEGPIYALDGPSYPPEAPIYAFDGPIYASEAATYPLDGLSYALDDPPYRPEGTMVKTRPSACRAKPTISASRSYLPTLLGDPLRWRTYDRSGSQVDVELLLVPYDTALRGWRSGAGPEHLVRAGLPAHLESQGHRVREVRLIEDDPAESPAEVRTAFELMRRVAVAVKRARTAGRFPVILSGNCNAAMGVLSGLTPADRSIFWFDAHGESNTPDTTASGFLDGMGLSIALGWCWRTVAASVPGYVPALPERTFLLGARDLDPLEAELLSQSRVTIVPPTQVSDELSRCLTEPRISGGLGYLHLDLDVLDPDSVGRANSHPAPGGLNLAQLTSAIGTIRSRVTLGAATIASYAPEYDHDQAVARAAFAALVTILGSTS